MNLLDDVHIEILNSSHNKKNFDCGEEKLNTFLEKHANQNQNKNASKTYVATNIKDHENTLGFYSLSSGQINREDLPTSKKYNHPHHPVSVVRISRLAVDKKYQGIGLGGLLLFDSLNKIKTVSKVIGIFAVIVDAKNNKTKQFYEHYGFKLLQDTNKTLFLPIDTILKC